MMVCFIAVFVSGQLAMAQYYNTDNVQRDAARRQAVLAAQGEVDRAHRLG